MNSKNEYNTYDELIDMLKKSDRDLDIEFIDKAYNFALESHGNQKRKSGVPYILHPVSVACILVELGMDTESIVAALLHDVVEDTDVNLEEVSKVFGADVANLINGVTKLGKIPYSSREEQQAENIRKMLMAMAHDVRVIIIKLADRLNNMRTIGCMSAQKQRDKALENMEVYAPIAHRLGISAIKEELEDISLTYLDPIAYKEIEDALALRADDRQAFINLTKERIMERISPIIPNIHLEGRVKSINGIYIKVFVQGRSIDEIYDIYAVRVIVDSVNDCYNVLGIIHDMFQPLPNRFKDYISTPKPNMYQSLHTTVVGKEAIPFEVQIRTWQMHYTAEYGIAAHWKYKLGISKTDSIEQRLYWIRQMLEYQKDNEDATDIIRNIKSDLIPEEVYVFTPKGDVISLPLGATVIDFAYAIHSEVGNRMIGAKVDKRIVPIDYSVKTGEIIEILTTKDASHGPSRDWLKIVQTSEARNKIRQWFKKEKKDENIVEGKRELDKEFRRNKIILPEKELQEFLNVIAKKHHCNSVEDLYAAIGYGGIHLSRIIPSIKDEYSKLRASYDKLETSKKESTVKTKKLYSSIEIEGMDDCLVKLSRCCNPLPGDDIVGFITRGYGVSVHKIDCSNVPENIEECDEKERWIPVYWAGEVKQLLSSNIEIIADNRSGLLADITSKLYSLNIFITSLNSRESKNGDAIINISINIKGLLQLKEIISQLSNISGVISVKRM